MRIRAGQIHNTTLPGRIDPSLYQVNESLRIILMIGRLWNLSISENKAVITSSSDTLAFPVLLSFGPNLCFQSHFYFAVVLSLFYKHYWRATLHLVTLGTRAHVCTLQYAKVPHCLYNNETMMRKLQHWLKREGARGGATLCHSSSNEWISDNDTSLTFEKGSIAYLVDVCH